MNKSCFIAIILVLASILSYPILAMEKEEHQNKKKSPYIQVRENPDLYNQITPGFAKEDFADLRLVCKDWAQKNKSWYFMPDSLEKKYDEFIKRKTTLTDLDKQKILFSLAAENDFDSVQWFINNTNGGDTIQINVSKKEITIAASMIAIHKKNDQIIRLLFESNPSHENQCWKNYRNHVTVPKEIEHCFYLGNNRDFSFLLYLTAVWMDNAHDLKKLYSKKHPTLLGKKHLIKTSLLNNSYKCCKELLEHKSIRKIIAFNLDFFKLAISTHQEAIPKMLLKKKLYSINGTFSDAPKEVTLDRYYKDPELKEDYKAIELLKHLGAKTWKQLEHEQAIRLARQQERERRRNAGYYD